MHNLSYIQTEPKRCPKTGLYIPIADNHHQLSYTTESIKDFDRGYAETDEWSIKEYFFNGYTGGVTLLNSVGYERYIQAEHCIELIKDKKLVNNKFRGLMTFYKAGATFWAKIT